MGFTSAQVALRRKVVFTYAPTGTLHSGRAVIEILKESGRERATTTVIITKDIRTLEFRPDDNP